MKDCVAGRIFDGGVAIFVPRDPRGNSRVAKPRGKSKTKALAREVPPATQATHSLVCLYGRTSFSFQEDIFCSQQPHQRY